MQIQNTIVEIKGETMRIINQIDTVEGISQGVCRSMSGTSTKTT